MPASGVVVRKIALQYNPDTFTRSFQLILAGVSRDRLRIIRNRQDRFDGRNRMNSPADQAFRPGRQQAPIGTSLWIAGFPGCDRLLYRCFSEAREIAR